MSKIELVSVTNPDRLTSINENFQKIEDALNNKALYRDNVEGEPNQMLDVLDMNGQKILNLAPAEGLTDAARLEDVYALAYQNQANIRGVWQTATAYAKFDLVRQGTATYVCIESHTSGTFATDLAANKWTVVGRLAPVASDVSVTPFGDVASTNVQAALQEIVSDLSASSGSSKVGYVQAGTGATATTQQEFNRRVVSPWDFMTDAQKASVIARNFAVDVSDAVQKAHDLSDYVIYWPGGYRCNNPITVNRAARAIGVGLLAVDVYFYGCNGFVVDATNNPGIKLENMAIRSVTSVGVADPRLYTGILCPGTLANQINYFVGEDLFMQGWNRCVDWQYTWNSNLSRVTTLNCNTGLRIFGLSVNNSINGCRLAANSGVAVIDLVADGSSIGEGLNVSDSLIASGQFGIRSNNGWLSLNIANCIIDLITDVGLKMVDTRKLSVSNSWVYSANAGIEYAALGTSVEVNAGLANVHIITTAGAGKGVVWGANNKGLTVSGGSISSGATGNCVLSDGDGVSVTGVRLVNPGSNPSLQFNGTDNSESGNTGNTKVAYALGKPSLSRGRQITYRTGLVYSASMTPDVSRGNLFNVVVTNTSPFTINAPTNPPADPETQELTITIANASGGALGTATWNAVYKMAAWTPPANGFGRSITFMWDGASWVERTRTTTDVPN